ncbi:MAG: ribosome maturation factor RimM [Gammaproteobacteria bacterium]|nr:ribosome maturation factor RimM [Gammaproteobacteria bacterium]
MAERQGEPVVLGRINGLFGVRGWLKVFSHTEPRDNILKYNPLLVFYQGHWQQIKLLNGRPQGKGIVLQFEGFDDRDHAATLIGSNIAINPEQLPELGSDEYYWTDMVGCKVVGVDGYELGELKSLFETGSNDVMVVKGERERLIPFLQPDVVKRVDLSERLIEVDWDPEF